MAVADGVPAWLGVPEPVRVSEAVRELVGDSDGVALPVGVTEGEGVRLGACDGDAEGLQTVLTARMRIAA